MAVVSVVFVDSLPAKQPATHKTTETKQKQLQRLLLILIGVPTSHALIIGGVPAFIQ